MKEEKPVDGSREEAEEQVLELPLVSEKAKPGEAKGLDGLYQDVVIKKGSNSWPPGHGI